MIQIRLSARDPSDLDAAEKAIAAVFTIHSRKRKQTDQNKYQKIYLLATKKARNGEKSSQLY